jgi:hypothetical protein
MARSQKAVFSVDVKKDELLVTLTLPAAVSVKV